METINLKKSSRMKRYSAIAGAGILAGIIAAGAGGVASAQTVVTDVAPPAAVVQQADLDAESGNEDFDFDISPEDEAVFEQFEQCLTGAGLDLEGDLEAEGEIDESAFEAAFDQCDPILDGLSDELNADLGDFDEGDFGLSEEDEAVFGQYEDCLDSAGIENLFEGEIVDEEAIEQAFESCEPILDGLSAEGQELLEDCPEDPEHDDVDTDDDAGADAETGDADV